MGDLTSICNILGLYYSGTKEQLLVRIINSLMDLNSLNKDNGKDNDEDEEVMKTAITRKTTIATLIVINRGRNERRSVT